MPEPEPEETPRPRADPAVRGHEVAVHWRLVVGACVYDVRHLGPCTAPSRARRPGAARRVATRRGSTCRAAMRRARATSMPRNASQYMIRTASVRETLEMGMRIWRCVARRGRGGVSARRAGAGVARREGVADIARCRPDAGGSPASTVLRSVLRAGWPARVQPTFTRCVMLARKSRHGHYLTTSICGGRDGRCRSSRATSSTAASAALSAVSAARRAAEPAADPVPAATGPGASRVVDDRQQSQAGAQAVGPPAASAAAALLDASAVRTAARACSTRLTR